MTTIETTIDEILRSASDILFVRDPNRPLTAEEQGQAETLIGQAAAADRVNRERLAHRIQKAREALDSVEACLTVRVGAPDSEGEAK